ncbi:MAG: leucyl/phenylalanyl-tRNA--protein transferase [Sporichthyaceae bacterium]
MPDVPTEPEPSPWAFPDPGAADERGLLGVGADTEPGTFLAAYRAGIFPMPLGRRGRVGWWSPNPRGVLPVDAVHVSRSLARSRRRFDVRMDTDFVGVLRGCAHPRRPRGWITPRMAAAYKRLHALGWAHSVETFDDSGRLVGGVFGVAIGGFFAGESMFHTATDASKAALIGLTEMLGSGTDAEHRLFDVQWTTPHLCSLGAVDIARPQYLERLDRALGLPLPPPFA